MHLRTYRTLSQFDHAHSGVAVLVETRLVGCRVLQLHPVVTNEIAVEKRAEDHRSVFVDGSLERIPWGVNASMHDAATLPAEPVSRLRLVEAVVRPASVVAEGIGTTG